MAEALRERARERGARVTVIGPAPAYIARRADRWRWNVVLRGDDPAALLEGGLEAALVGRRGPRVAAVTESGSMAHADFGESCEDVRPR